MEKFKDWLYLDSPLAWFAAKVATLNDWFFKKQMNRIFGNDWTEQ